MFRRNVVTQEAFVKLIPELKKATAEAAGQNKKLDLPAFLRARGYTPPILDRINFTSLPECVTRMTAAKGSVDIFHGSSLLTNIDYSGCEFNECILNYCNLSNSIFANQNFISCQMVGTVMQNIVATNVSITDCNAQGITFDASQLNEMVFENNDMSNSRFTALKQCNDFIIDNCILNGINFLGGATANNCTISYDQETQINNASFFHNQFKLINANIGICNARVGLTWCNQIPGYLANLARCAMEEKKMQPILVEYNPPDIDVKALDKEIESAIKHASEKMSPRAKDDKSSPTAQPSSLPFLTIETALKQPAEFPNMVKLYKYAETALSNLDGLVIPGGADIYPIFYGEKTGEFTQPASDKRRDLFEFSILHIQKNSGMPIYGICRGSQVIAVAYGAGFHQHVGADRKYIGEQPKLVDPDRPRAALSQIHTITSPNKGSSQEKADSPTLSSSPAKQDSSVVLFVHHQGYSFEPINAETALFEVLATTSIASQRKDDPPIQLNVALESLPRNIYLTQFHPEGGQDPRLVRDLRISTDLASHFLDAFSARVDTYKSERERGTAHRMRLTERRGHYLLNPSRIDEITTPRMATSPHKHQYDTVIVGMGTVALVAGLTALSRGEKVAFVKDHSASHKKSEIQQQIATIDDDTFKLIQQSIRAPIFNKYTQQDDRVKQVMDAKSYTGVTADTLEKMVLEEIDARRNESKSAIADIFEVEQIDPDVLKNISMERTSDQTKVTLPELRNITQLRAQQSVDMQKHTLTLARVRRVNDEKVPSDNDVVHLGFNILQVCNGKERSIEKGIAELGADNSLLAMPCVPHHATVTFNIRPEYKMSELMKDMPSDAKLMSPLHPVSLGTLSKYEWKTCSRPHSQVALTEAKNKNSLSILCEIPESLAKASHSADMATRLNADQKIREFAYLLLKDHLPIAAYDKAIIDPEKEDRKDVKNGSSHQSIYELDLAELTSTFILKEGSQKDIPSVIGFFGEGRILPLQTIGGGLQTELKLARYFHEAQSKLLSGLTTLRSRKLEAKDYDTEAQKICSEIYSEYHAKARREIDTVRGAQMKWVEQRNARHTTACLAENIYTDTHHIHSSMQKMLDEIKHHSLLDTFKEEPPKATLFATATPVQHKKLNDDIQRVFSTLDDVKNTLEKSCCHLDRSDVIAFENLHQQLEFKSLAHMYDSLHDSCVKLNTLQPIIQEMKTSFEDKSLSPSKVQNMSRLVTLYENLISSGSWQAFMRHQNTLHPTLSAADGKHVVTHKK